MPYMHITATVEIDEIPVVPDRAETLGEMLALFGEVQQVTVGIRGTKEFPVELAAFSEDEEGPSVLCVTDPVNGWSALVEYDDVLFLAR